MKFKLLSTVTALALVISSLGTAQAFNNDGIKGLMFGGVSGAIMGKAIGGEAKGVIIGSLLGGTLGMLIDMDTGRNHTVIMDGHRHGKRTRFEYNNIRDERHDRRHRIKNRKPHRHNRPWRRESRRHRRY